MQTPVKCVNVENSFFMKYLPLLSIIERLEWVNEMSRMSLSSDKYVLKIKEYLKDP